MTAVDPRVGAPHQIGQRRRVSDVQTGWHIELSSGWHLVVDVIPNTFTGDVMLVLRDGPFGERGVPLLVTDRLMTRTAEEHIQWVEERTRVGEGER